MRWLLKTLSALLLLPIYFYQKCISPFTPPSCRSKDCTWPCGACCVAIRGEVRGMTRCLDSPFHLYAHERLS